MYDTVADPYCYPGTTILKNIPDLHDQAALDEFEAVITAQRADEPLPEGRFSIAHYKAIHYHLFQDVYAWAGKSRTMRTGKDGSAFCYPKNIDREMKRLFAALKHERYFKNLSPIDFATEAAGFLSALNAIHPFREGNGRTQTTFLALLADRAGHPLHLGRLESEKFLTAMIASFKGNDAPLERQILLLTKEPLI